jgi:hypothetical protein
MSGSKGSGQAFYFEIPTQLAGGPFKPGFGLSGDQHQDRQGWMIHI